MPGTIVTALFFIFVAGKGVRAQFKPAVTGLEAMIGKTVNTLSRYMVWCQPPLREHCDRCGRTDLCRG